MIRGIKGVKDILPDDMPRWEAIEWTARRLARVYGFREIRVPIFELTELFARSIGASTDIVEKEMYTFPDRDGKLLTLRPEATAGVVRAYVEHNLGASSALQKFYYLGPMFRHERPQAGRLRQFHQFGVEYFGTASPGADVEVITLLWRFLSDLRLPDLTLEVNSLGDSEDRRGYTVALLQFLAPREAQLCANCRRRMATNPLRVLDCKVPECAGILKDAPALTEHLSAASRAHFEGVLTGLRSTGIAYIVNPRLVRGLDYYTLTAFEVTSGHLGAQNAVGAGGRYDGLVAALGGSATPAVGFAVGLERVALMLPPAVVPSALPSVFVAGFGTNGASEGLRILRELRDRGICTDTDYRAGTLKSLLRQADRQAATYVVIVGDDEAAAGEVLLRNMLTKEQETLPRDTLVTTLLTRLEIK
jgi:histidyl-tRNA synthetase